MLACFLVYAKVDAASAGRCERTEVEQPFTIKPGDTLACERRSARAPSLQGRPLVLGRPLHLRALLVPVVVARNQPDLSQDLERHALSVVLDGDGRRVFLGQIHRDNGNVGIRIIGVLDEFEAASRALPISSSPSS